MSWLEMSQRQIWERKNAPLFLVSVNSIQTDYLIVIQKNETFPWYFNLIVWWALFVIHKIKLDLLSYLIRVVKEWDTRSLPSSLSNNFIQFSGKVNQIINSISHSWSWHPRSGKFWDQWLKYDSLDICEIIDSLEVCGIIDSFEVCGGFNLCEECVIDSLEVYVNNDLSTECVSMTLWKYLWTLPNEESVSLTLVKFTWTLTYKAKVQRIHLLCIGLSNHY